MYLPPKVRPLVMVFGENTLTDELNYIPVYPLRDNISD
jgi:hypothetical protein